MVGLDEMLGDAIGDIHSEASAEEELEEVVVVGWGHLPKVLKDCSFESAQREAIGFLLHELEEGVKLGEVGQIDQHLCWLGR